jgi:hypothetical protein
VVDEAGGDADQFAAQPGDGGSSAAVSAVDAGDFLQPRRHRTGQQGRSHPHGVEGGVPGGQVP